MPCSETVENMLKPQLQQVLDKPGTHQVKKNLWNLCSLVLLILFPVYYQFSPYVFKEQKRTENQPKHHFTADWTDDHIHVCKQCLKLIGIDAALFRNGASLLALNLLVSALSRETPSAIGELQQPGGNNLLERKIWLEGTDGKVVSRCDI